MKTTMALDSVLGNEPVRSALLHALGTKSLSHAVLLTAPDGCGRNYWARCLAADYLFPEGGEANKAVLRGESSEVITLAGEGLSGQIRVERIREVRTDIYRTGLSSFGRVVLIRDAERMMAPAANALLKVLEEPPRGVLFVLTARDASGLLQTIRSRCVLYPLAEISPEDTVSFLLEHGAEASFAQLLATVYGGRPGLCLRVLESAERRQTFENAKAAAKAAATGNLYALLCLFSVLEGRKEEEKKRRLEFLQDLSLVFTACLYGKFSQEEGSACAQQATRFLPFVLNALSDLQANVAPKLVFSSLAIQLTEETL